MVPFAAVFRTSWPVHWRFLVVLALYAGYLPISGYSVSQYRFDAAEYWEMSLKFTQHGQFSMLAFDEPVRGYLSPLLILPARLLCHFTGWSMLTGARVLGAGWAALLFAVAIPQLWAQVLGQPMRVGRWLLLVGLGFIFWRDYFNFTLSDMPALTVLLLSLVALPRRGWGWAGAAGILLAAAINIRPIYVAAVPGWLWLALISRPPGASQWGRAMAVVVGVGLVLAPQWCINRQHFRQATPLVLGARPGTPSLFLKQLAWGTAFQRYESSLVPEMPRSLLYADSVSRHELAREPRQRFSSYAHYLRFIAARPLGTVQRYLKHLFNGLDLRFSTPYPTQLHPPGQWAFRLLNYTVIGVGAWLAAVFLWRRSSAPGPPAVGAAAALAVLLPCALVLPTLMECRFLLPLHLLLLTIFSACWQPVAWWRSNASGRRLGVIVLALGWLWGCWQLSEATAGQIRPQSEVPYD